MITLTVASILLFIAMPSFLTFLQNTRLTGQHNDLVADLTLARTESVKRGINVSVCKSTNPTADSPSCNTTAGDPWTSGRLVSVYIVAQHARFPSAISLPLSVKRVRPVILMAMDRP